VKGCPSVGRSRCLGDGGGLSQRERNLLTCAMLVALNRGPQLRIHVAGALEGFRIAGEVFAEAGE
jgi:alkylhydroperoxidase/carboxymuconolactone decarboxylase family protein YurZ